ncbi:MAG: hypothetical protein WCA36_19755 [Pseudolabrys sp.]
MARAIAVIAGSKAALLHHPLSFVTQRLATVWRAMSHDAAHPYRPERYYMRGPGPACQAKNGGMGGGKPTA